VGGIIAHYSHNLLIPRLTLFLPTLEWWIYTLGWTQTTIF